MSIPYRNRGLQALDDIYGFDGLHPSSTFDPGPIIRVHDTGPLASALTSTVGRDGSYWMLRCLATLVVTGNFDDVFNIDDFYALLRPNPPSSVRHWILDVTLESDVSNVTNLVVALKTSGQGSIFGNIAVADRISGNWPLLIPGTLDKETGTPSEFVALTTTRCHLPKFVPPGSVISIRGTSVAANALDFLAHMWSGPLGTSPP